MENKSSEKKRLKSLSNWYFDHQLDFDKKLIYFGYQTIRPYFRGSSCLELGSADGQMTRLLIQDFKKLTVVDGSAQLLQSLPKHNRLFKIHSLFEEFKPQEEFDIIIMAHILEHIQKPAGLLKRARLWLKPKGKIIIIVPNANSFHRLAAVKMKLLKYPHQLNARDHALGHRRVYTPASLLRDTRKAGLQTLVQGGIFFKPLSHQQIQEQWTNQMIHGFYELGKDFPENAAEIYCVCQAGL